ncbi:unnamed protein product [Tilletia caries]|uniref:Uncharacterized protein n=1 Tax=Tilletia caries TaxID=13290 RepID=A0ABN7J1N9_9BASI|nr:unnamed protein product [Tilletia caries]
MLAHFPDNVERFGPSFSYNTERFESFNSPIREASVHSNRQAPSTDILTRLYDQELVRHVMDDGEWIEKDKVQKASSRVLAFAQSAESKVLMQKWGIQSVKKRVTPGSVTVNARAPPRAILQDEQIRAQLFEEVLQPVDDMYEEGLEISSLSQDLCKVKSHVLVEVEQGDLNATVGRITAIWKGEKRQEAALVQLCLLDDAGWSKKWEMRQLVDRGRMVIVRASRIILKVNS